MDKVEMLKVRIRALRTMTTENGCTENEALNAAELAARLLAEHGISLAEVESIRAQQTVGADVSEVKIDKPYAEIDFCIVAAARFFDCTSWRNWAGGYTLLGLPEDVFAAETLVCIIGDAMTVSWTDYKLHKRRLPLGWQDDPTEHDRIRWSFLGSMAQRLSSRLDAVKKGLSTGRNALIVVKSAIVDRALKERGIQLTRGRPSPSPREDFHASVAGASAGERIDISNPFKLKRAN